MSSLRTSEPVFLRATRHIPSDPSAGTTSNPMRLSASVSLPEPHPRSRTLEPGARRRTKRSMIPDTSLPIVESEYPSGSPS